MTNMARGFRSVLQSGLVKWPIWLPLAVVASFLIVATSSGVYDLGLFELDSNALDNATKPGDDWATLYYGGGNAFAYQHTADPVPDDIHQTGGTRDTGDIPGWRWTLGSAHHTQDITNAYAAAYQDDGDLFIYFGLDRFDNNGDAVVGFWFLQQHVHPNGDGTWNGEHEVGDTLVLSHFTGGGTIVGIEVYQWVGSGGSDETLDHVYSGGDCSLGTASDPVCAEVNAYYTPAAWPYVSKSGTSGVFPPGTLYEAGLNVGAFVPDGSWFATFIAETRSSMSLAAQLKDFALGYLEMRCIRGHAYEDFDADGDLGDGISLDGWAINLYADGALVDTTTTNEQGQYLFAGLADGTYRVEEVCKTGWAQSVPTPSQGCGSGLFDGIVIDRDHPDQGPLDFGNYRETTVVIREATNPVGGTGFGFSDNIEAPHAFGLADGASRAFFHLVPGNYTVTEDDPTPEWDLTGLVCIDPDGGSSVDLDARTASIDLDPGETVECTFTNTQRGTVIINKVTIPAGGTGFDFAYAIDTPILFRQGDGGSKTFSNVVPGGYAVSEGDPAPEWYLVGLVCADPDGGTTIDLDARTALIDVDPGEIVECTFTNRQRGTVIYLPLAGR